MIRLLNTCRFADADDRRRLWVDIGQPVLIGRNQSLTVLEHTIDGEPEIFLRVEVPGDFMESSVPLDCYVDVSSWARMKIVPRAVDIDQRNRAKRAFVEFVRTTKSVGWAV